MYSPDILCSPKHKFSRHISKTYLNPTQPEAPKKLLRLRSELPSLFSPISWSSNQTDSSLNSSFGKNEIYHNNNNLDQGNESSCTLPTPEPIPGYEKFHLTFIEKENRRPRIRSMKSIHQQQAVFNPHHHHQHHNQYAGVNSTKSSTTSLMRTPSSGISSSSSSENMVPGLTIYTDDDRRMREEILDPSVEVDLDVFLTPELGHQPMMPPPKMVYVGGDAMAPQSFMRSSRGSARQHAQQQKQQQQLEYTNPVFGGAAPMRKESTSYGFVKQQPEFSDYPSWMQSSMASSSTTTGVGSGSSSSQSHPQPRGCNYCWESYVKLCNRVAKLDPVFPVDGPWNWHSLYDAHGRVSCPRLWFVQLDRAGTEMLEQMAHKRQNTVF